jgi:hypothetical protein
VLVEHCETETTSTNHLIHGHGSCQHQRHDPGKLHSISLVQQICFSARCVERLAAPEPTYRSRFRSQFAWSGSGSGWRPSRAQAVGHQGRRACQTSSQASQLPLLAGRPASRGRARGHCLRGVSGVAKAVNSVQARHTQQLVNVLGELLAIVRVSLFPGPNVARIRGIAWGVELTLEAIADILVVRSAFRAFPV